MKRISLFVAIFMFSMIFAMSSHAQTGPQANAGKVAFIDSAAFENEKEGITRFVNAMKVLRAEVTPKDQELTSIQNKLKTLSDELNKMTSNPNVPVDQSAAVAKQYEGQRLQREFEYKKKELEAYIERRQRELLGPIQSDIAKAIQDYATQKGYAAIMDIDKLAQAGALLAMDPKSEITKDFIVFFNARPAGTASTAAPK